MPLGQWTFISHFTDQTTNTQYGFRYFLDQTTKTRKVKFQQRNSGTCYQLKPSAKVFWGGSDGYYGYCNCWMQYVRVHIDWVADSENKMLSLAFMDSGINLLKRSADTLIV